MNHIFSQHVKESLTHVISTWERYEAVKSGIFMMHGKLIWKPKAVWISMNGDWERWCTSEDFINIDKCVVVDVKLKKNLKLLKITTIKQADELALFMGLRSKHISTKLGAESWEYDCRPSEMMSMTHYLTDQLKNGELEPNPWKVVIDAYDGLYFLNSSKLHYETFFNTWDVDSIAVFRPFENIMVSNPRMGKALKH